MTKDLITIGLMTYNNEDTLVRALESLVHQDYSQKEIIIFDDSSTDKTYEICQDYTKRFSFIRPFRNSENIGMFRNLEQLLSRVTGEYFLWACADDEYDTSFLTKCLAPLKKDDRIIISTPAIKVVYETGQEVIFRYHDFLKNISFKDMAQNIMQARDVDGTYVAYNSIIHTPLRSAYLRKVHYMSQLIFCEELWTINALIWGRVFYTDEPLFTKYESSIPYSIRLPEYHKAVSSRFRQIGYALEYLVHFLLQKPMPWNKKMKYFLVFLWAMRLRVLTRNILWNSFRGFFVKCDEIFFLGALKKLYRFTRRKHS